VLATSTLLNTRVTATTARRSLQVRRCITLDLTTVPAASGSDVTLPDGSIIKANNQFLRYGQVMTQDHHRHQSDVDTGTAT
jgi:hypothetical protein